MSEKNTAAHTELLLELGELHSKVLQTKTTLETKISLIKASIKNDEYVIHPHRIVEHMLEDTADTYTFLAESLLS